MMAEKMRNDCMRKAHGKPIQRFHFIVRTSSIGSKKEITLNTDCRPEVLPQEKQSFIFSK